MIHELDEFFCWFRTMGVFVIREGKIDMCFVKFISILGVLLLTSYIYLYTYTFCKWVGRILLVALASISS